MSRTVASKCIKVENGLIVLILKDLEDMQISSLNKLKEKDLKVFFTEYGVLLTIYDKIEIPFDESSLDHLVKVPRLFIYGGGITSYEATLIADLQFPSDQVVQIKGAYLFQKNQQT